MKNFLKVLVGILGIINMIISVLVLKFLPIIAVILVILSLLGMIQYSILTILGYSLVIYVCGLIYLFINVMLSSLSLNSVR